MRWLAALAVTVAVLAACEETTSGPSNGLLVCNPDGSCPNGFVCVYDVTQGCDAPAVCIMPPADAGLCQSAALCACNGGLTSECGTPGYAPTPVAPPDECGSTDGGVE